MMPKPTRKKIDLSYRKILAVQNFLVSKFLCLLASEYTKKLKGYGNVFHTAKFNEI